MENPEETFHFFHYDVAVCVLHEFMTFAVLFVSSTTICGFLEQTIATLARLDAIVANKATYLPSNRSERLTSIGKSCAMKQSLCIFQSPLRS